MLSSSLILLVNLSSLAVAVVLLFRSVVSFSRDRLATADSVRVATVLQGKRANFFLIPLFCCINGFNTLITTIDITKRFLMFGSDLLSP